MSGARASSSGAVAANEQDTSAAAQAPGPACGAVAASGCAAEPLAAGDGEGAGGGGGGDGMALFARRLARGSRLVLFNDNRGRLLIGSIQMFVLSVEGALPVHVTPSRLCGAPGAFPMRRPAVVPKPPAIVMLFYTLTGVYEQWEMQLCGPFTSEGPQQQWSRLRVQLRSRQLPKAQFVVEVCWRRPH